MTALSCPEAAAATQVLTVTTTGEAAGSEAMSAVSLSMPQAEPAEELPMWTEPQSVRHSSIPLSDVLSVQTE